MKATVLFASSVLLRSMLLFTLLGSAVICCAQQPIVPLHVLASASEGNWPNDTLVQDKSGNFYGTCKSGGPAGNGTIFMVTRTGAVKILYTFPALTQDDEDNYYNTTGVSPAGLLLAKDGNLYGTCMAGGLNDSGTIFREPTTGGEPTILWTFSEDGRTDGSYPYGGLVQDANGYLYGTCDGGGANDTGTLYKVSTAGGNPNVLWSFSELDDSQSPPTNPDGANPTCTLLLGKDGSLYGTCGSGGAYGVGTVFREPTAGGQPTTLHAFTYSANGRNADGIVPQQGLLQGPDSNLYGTCMEGGANGYGVVFQLTTGGVLTVLNAFGSATPADGKLPGYGLIQSVIDGNIYGTTREGGLNGSGTVFRISTDSRTAKFDVGSPLTTVAALRVGVYDAGLTQGMDGAIYATTGDYADGGTFSRVGPIPYFQFNAGVNGSGVPDTFDLDYDTLYSGCFLCAGSSLVTLYPTLFTWNAVNLDNYLKAHNGYDNSGNIYAKSIPRYSMADSNTIAASSYGTLNAYLVETLVTKGDFVILKLQETKTVLTGTGKGTRTTGAHFVLATGLIYGPMGPIDCAVFDPGWNPLPPSTTPAANLGTLSGHFAGFTHNSGLYFSTFTVQAEYAYSKPEY